VTVTSAQPGNGNGDSGYEPFTGDSFIVTVDTTIQGRTNDTTFQIQTEDVLYNYSVDWSQGSASDLTDNFNVTWDTPGTYEVRVSGNQNRGDQPMGRYPVVRDCKDVHGSWES
jgi:hypothetical protein